MKIFSKLKWFDRHKMLGYSKDELEPHMSTWVEECDGKVVEEGDDGFLYCNDYIIDEMWCDEDGDHIPRIN